jgi:hypothetical protein
VSQSNYPLPVDPEIAQWTNTLDENTRERFEERASIRQYVGGASRQDAELGAYNDIQRWLSEKS